MPATQFPFSRFIGPRKKLTPQRVLRMLHLYLGLLCSGYFVMIGLSSISLNHPDSVVAPPVENLHWEATIPDAGPELGDASTRAQHIKDSLGLIGTTPQWRIEASDNGDLAFFAWRPGRSYQVRYTRASGKARVAETREGVWGVLRHLHGAPKVAELRGWSTAWWLYNEISLAAIFVSLVSGATLWWPRIRERRTGLLVAALGVAGCLGLLLSVWR